MLLAAIKSMQEQAIYSPGPLKLIIQLRGEPLTQLANQIEEYERTYKNWYWWQRWWNARKTKEIERKRQMLCLAWLWNEAELRDSGAGPSEERCLIGEKLKHHLPKLGKKYWIDGKEWRGYWQDEWVKRNTQRYTKASVVFSQEKGWFSWMMVFFKKEEGRKVISREEMQIESCLNDLTTLIEVACSALKQAEEKLKEGILSKEDMQKLIEHRNERIVDLYEKINVSLYKKPNEIIWDKYKEKLIQARVMWLNAKNNADLFLIETTLWEKKKVIIDSWKQDKEQIKQVLEEAINKLVELKVEKKEEESPEIEKEIKNELASLRRHILFKYHPDHHKEYPQKMTAESIFKEAEPLFKLFFTILEKPRVAAGIQLVITDINEFDGSKLLMQINRMQNCFDAGGSKELDEFLYHAERIVNGKVKYKELKAKLQKEIEERKRTEEESDERIAKMQAKIKENEVKMQKEIEESDERIAKMQAKMQKEIEESDERIAKMQAKMQKEIEESKRREAEMQAEMQAKIKAQDEKMNVLFALVNESIRKENLSEKSKEKLDPIIPEPTTNHQEDAKPGSNIAFTFFGQKKEDNKEDNKEPNKELVNKIELK